MNKGLFSAQVNEAEKLLKSLGLLQNRVTPLYNLYGSADFKRLSYTQIWQKCFTEQIYDFCLTDSSLVQFRYSAFASQGFSYTYYDCPFRPLPSYETYREERGGEHEEYWDEYETLREYDLLVVERKETVTPLRYDFHPGQYSAGRHPAAHLHMGHDNEIRIGTRRELLPVSFVLFAIRQCYPDHWVRFLASSDAQLVCRNIHTNLKPIEPRYIQELDRLEMYLE